MQPESERFTTPSLAGTELHTQAWGDPTAPLWVVLHGGGANGHWWDHLAPAWADAHRVVALDFRGHGDSDYPEDRQPGAFNDDLSALLEYLGRSDVVLIGHSMGAHVALDHAAHHPATRSLVLIELSRGGERRSRRVARLALSLRRAYSTREEAVDRFRFIPGAVHVEESLRHSIAANSVQPTADGRWAFKFDPRWFALPRAKFVPLSKVQCPVLILRGERSSVLTPDGAKAVVSELPVATLVEIKTAGHNVHLECPNEVVNAILAFL